MPGALDITGQRFGRLTAIHKVDSHVTRSGHTFTKWLCRCDCGNEVATLTNALRSLHSQSCGCRKRDLTIARTTTHGSSVRDGKRDTTYSAWRAMLGRCYTESNISYTNYGARGIAVCQQWRDSFEAFLRDMGPRPQGMTLDRFPDNDGDYGPGNCRWATKQQQDSNKRTTVHVTRDGLTLTLSEWGRRMNIDPATLGRKWRKQGLITKKPNFRKGRAVRQLSKGGEEIATFISIADAAVSTGVSPGAICTVCSGGRLKTTGGFKWEYINGKNYDQTQHSDD